jgi:large subunit ribosomal protein L20
MPRSVNHVASRARRKKVLKAARGFYGARSKVLTVAKHTLDRAMAYAYIHRKAKKRAFRRLWIVRINAGSRPLGITYSRLMFALAAKGIELNRKVLADLALNNPATFAAIVNSVK